MRVGKESVFLTGVSRISAAAVIGFWMAAAPAYAQSEVESGTGEAEQEESAVGRNVIVVTAQKREQAIDEITTAITAVSGEELTARDITDFTDLQEISPSLRITGTGANGNISIRGIGTSVFSTSAESAVLPVIDDLATLQSGQALDALSDVERVEVLRGPQGTLFGKGASAGVINIVSRGPTDQFQANFNGQYVDDGRLNIQLGAGGYLTEGVGIRVAGYYNDNSGFVRNRATGTMLGGLQGYGFRTKLRLEPTDNLTLDINYSHAETDETVAPPTYRVLPPNTGLPIGVIANDFLGGVQPGPDNREVNANYDSTRASNTDVISLRGEYDLGFASIVSITGWQDWRNETFNDFDGTTAPVFFTPDGITQGGPYKAQLFSQELRMVSNGDGPLQWLVGAYYADGETDRQFTRSVNCCFPSDWDSTAGTTTTAIFANASYMLPSRTEITAGIRYNNERISVEFLNLLPSNNPPPNNQSCRQLCTGESSDDVVTYKLAVRQELNPDMSVYASFSTGYKGGAYDITSGFSPSRAANPAAPETVDSYELGYRGVILDGRAVIALTGFYTDYDEFQRQAVVVPPDPNDPPEFRLTNVGSLRTKGVELELRTNPVDGLQLNGFLAYIDATITEYPDAPCYNGQTEAQGCIDPDGPGGSDPIQDLAGTRLNGVPEWSYNIFARYDFDTPSVPFDPFIQADWSYRSSILNDFLGDPDATTEARSILDAAFGASFRDSDLTLTVFVNNVLDKSYNSTGGAPAFHPTTVETNNIFRDQGRSFGARLSVRY
ncbi:TonB-dependent receptor [Aurantiacibacter gilvus]|uniref:TonB-dependent receptor n=1 Tax=Aurantiacibacter gilvus TaxID=3139141 RepID=A0ABU9IG44_9SPHN